MRPECQSHSIGRSFVNSGRVRKSLPFWTLSVGTLGSLPDPPIDVRWQSLTGTKVACCSFDLILTVQPDTACDPGPPPGPGPAAPREADPTPATKFRLQKTFRTVCRFAIVREIAGRNLKLDPPISAPAADLDSA